MKVSHLVSVFLLAGRVTSQAFITLHNFSAYYAPSYTNDDGAQPQAGLILSGNTLYGTTEAGGTSGNGTVFAIHTNGTGFTNLYVFTATPASTNSDGKGPFGSLTLLSNRLYGTTVIGGNSGNGTVFAVNTNGSGFVTLHSFSATVAGTNSDGAKPQTGLVLSGNALYGTAVFGGTSGNGTVFKIDPDGSNFTTLYAFTKTTGSTNGDGIWPYGGLIVLSNALYGTANQGGSSGNGTIFKINIDGSGFTSLHTFTHTDFGTNCDGANPYGGLIISGNTLYGTANRGGSFDGGTIFALNISGADFTNLHTFAPISGESNTNIDGWYPLASLTFSGNTLYGTAQYGGSSGSGTVFAINTNGSDFMTLHSFSPFGSYGSVHYTTNSNGAWPGTGLIISDNTLYGTTWVGGNSGVGTVFKMRLPTPLFFAKTINQLVFTWTNANFSLQSAPLVTGVYTNIPDATSPYTNAIIGTQQYFRLIEN
ncbi:MAG: hypothetical protein RLZZ350_2488 [Verrucomicrobiota bacterium]|jgi:uncharacterized repeat protein (TIGR03803 family)